MRPIGRKFGKGNRTWSRGEGKNSRSLNRSRNPYHNVRHTCIVNPPLQPDWSVTSSPNLPHRHCVFVSFRFVSLLTPPLSRQVQKYLFRHHRTHNTRTHTLYTCFSTTSAIRFSVSSAGTAFIAHFVRIAPHRIPSFVGSFLHAATFVSSMCVYILPGCFRATCLTLTRTREMRSFCFRWKRNAYLRIPIRNLSIDI